MENRKLVGFLLRILAIIVVVSASGCLGVPYQRPAVAFFQRPSIYFQPQQGGYPFQSQSQFPFGGFGGGFARPAPPGNAQPGGFINPLQPGQVPFSPLLAGTPGQGQGQGLFTFPAGIDTGLIVNGTQGQGFGLAAPTG